MELIISVLMLFVVLNCATKLSLWNWWQRFAFSAVLAAFIWWSERYAVLQSKTQLADLLQNAEALQNMAVIVTIESAVNFGFCFWWFGEVNSEELRVKNSKPSQKNFSLFTIHYSLLKWYPSLLIFPVMFYVLTQTMFMAVGVDFAVSSIAVAALTFVLLPLLAEGMKWFIADADGRVEIHVLLSCLVCVLGLATTVTSKMIYRANEAPIDWQMVSLAIVIFVILFVAGFLGSKLKWRWKKFITRNS